MTRLPVEPGPAPSRRDLLCAAAALPVIGAAACSGPDVGALPEPEVEPTTKPRLVRRSSERGHADHGWLDTCHTFSFAGYHDPSYMGFGPLRVLNQDRVAGGGGFPMHGHRDMEIVSYVLEGAMAHQDTMGNGSRMRPGDVQLMSAGTGVKHSEFNASASDGLHFLQMWVTPARAGTAPRYEQRTYSREERQGALRLVVSPDADDGSLTIGQDARLYAALLADSDAAEHTVEAERVAWLHVATGTVELDGVRLGPGDGVGFRGGDRLSLKGVGDAEFLLWDLAARGS